MPLVRTFAGWYQRLRSPALTPAHIHDTDATRTQTAQTDVKSTLLGKTALTRGTRPIDQFATAQRQNSETGARCKSVGA